MWERLFTAVDCAVSACYSCIKYLDFSSLPCHLSSDVIITAWQRGKFESK